MGGERFFSRGSRPRLIEISETVLAKDLTFRRLKGRVFKRSEVPDEWRGVQAKEQIVKGAIYGVVPDIDEVERLFLIIKAQSEY